VRQVSHRVAVMQPALSVLPTAVSKPDTKHLTNAEPAVKGDQGPMPGTVGPEVDVALREGFDVLPVESSGPTAATVCGARRRRRSAIPMQLHSHQPKWRVTREHKLGRSLCEFHLNKAADGS